jgi:hypothetical protein
MPKEQPIEIFMPPNVLKAKVGGGGGIDSSVLKRAEQAIEGLKDEFAEWILKDLDRLTTARSAFERDRKGDNFNALYRAALDLKGQGTTFDFPLVARVAASLATLTDGTTAALLPMALIDGHVDAIKVIVREKIKDPADPVACVLASELEKKVTDFLAKKPA